MKGLKYCFLDLGGVLFHVDQKHVWQTLARSSPLSVERLQERFRGDGSMILFETGELTEDEFWQRLRQLFEIDLSDASIKYIWKHSLTPIEANLKAVHLLAGKVSRYIISNTNSAHLDRIYELAPELNMLPASFSHKVGYLKPRQEIYRHALDNIRAEPALSLFIDDRADNVAAARNLGMQAHQLTDPGQLSQILKRYFKL